MLLSVRVGGRGLGHEVYENLTKQSLEEVYVQNHAVSLSECVFCDGLTCLKCAPPVMHKRPGGLLRAILNMLGYRVIR